MSVNKVILIGNVGQVGDLRQAGQSSVLQFSLATSERYKKGEEWVEDTTWHTVVVWGGSAEYLNSRIEKGSKVFVEGKIKNRKYTDKDGIERSVVDINATNVEVLDGKKTAPAADPQPAQPRRETIGAAKAFTSSVEDDLPF